MTTRTWVGGVNNNVYHRNNWSPFGPIQPGDTLLMYSGTANMAGGNLSGDTLYVGTQTMYGVNTPPAVVNLSDGASLTAVVATTAFTHQNIVFNVKGDDTLNLTVDNNYYATTTTTVKIGADSQLRGTVTVGGHNGNLTMIGAAGSAFKNVGASSVETNSVATINAEVLGIGNFTVGGESGLSFLRAVGAGQSVTLEGFDTLTIGMPRAFLGDVKAPTTGAPFAIDLAGITKADSYSYANDMLVLFRGNRVVDKLRFADATSFKIGENSAGVFIGSGNSLIPPGTILLPQHHFV